MAQAGTVSRGTRDDSVIMTGTSADAARIHNIPNDRFVV